MKRNQTIALLGALAVAAQNLMAVSTSETKADKLFTDAVVAKAKGFEIKTSELDEAFVNAKAAAATRNIEFSDAEREMIKARLLDELIVGKILTAKATEADKTKAAESAQKFIADTRARMGEEAFKQQLTISKLASVDELQKKFVSEALPNLVLDREIKPLVTVTDAAAKKFYDENPDKFEQPEAVRAAHILCATRDSETNTEFPAAKKDEKKKLINDLLKRAKAGEDFAKLAKEYSDDPGSKNTGGEYTFPRGQMMPEFEAAAFALKKAGDISEVITTAYGFHIIKLNEKIAAKTLTLADVAPRIKEGLARQEAAKLIPDYMDKLEKDAGTEILDAKLIEAKKKAKELAKAAMEEAAAKAVLKK
jgi:peptidyl-prolyl cis-trans isomerase C